MLSRWARRAAPRGPTVALLCGTHHPGAVVAACLRDVADCVDEVIIAADGRVAEQDLDAYATVADRVIPFPFTGRNAFRPWLAAQTEADWILWLDGDEVPAAALVADLRRLVSDRDVAGWLLPRDWVWPDPTTMLVDEPWSPDLQLRLVRNDARLWFPGRPHTGAVTTGPQRIADVGFYHLDLVLKGVDERRAKADRNDSEESEQVTHRGDPINHAFYLPEDRLAPATATIAERDQRAIAQVVAANERPASVRAARRRPSIHDPVPVGELERWHDDRPLRDDDYLAGLSVEALDEIPADAQAELWVRVTNRSRGPWQADGDRRPVLVVSSHWYAEDGSVASWDGPRAALPHTLKPGHTADVRLTVIAPEAPGRHELAIDLLHEHHRWAGAEIRQEVEVGISITDDLDPHRSGGPISLEAAWSARKRLDLLDGLSLCLRPSVGGDLADEPCANAICGMPVGGWALDEPTLRILADWVRSGRPQSILEFGSGTSTVLLAAVLRDIGHGGHLLSVEQDESVAAAISEQLRDCGLDDVARVVVAPLVDLEVNGLTTTSYKLDRGVFDLLHAPPDLVLIDGPSRAAGGSRFPIVPMVQPIVEGATFFLDDAWRDAELLMSSRWSDMPGITVRGIYNTPHGLLEGRIERISPG